MRDSLFDVSKEIVVITGASGLLGLQYCKAFLERGSRVAGLDVTASHGLEELLGAFSRSLIFVRADVTRKETLVKALEKITEAFGIPTVLINNAAIDAPPDAPASENGPFEDYPDASFERIMDVNVKGVYLCCKVFGSAMVRQGRGSIINVSSIYGVLAPDQSLYEYRRRRGELFYKPIAYSVSKSAILNLTRYLAVYWARKNVRVNTVVLAGVYNNQDKEFLDAYCSRIPIGRMAQPDEYNGLMIFLASPASAYMTGSTLVMDGGWTAI